LCSTGIERFIERALFVGLLQRRECAPPVGAARLLHLPLEIGEALLDGRFGLVTLRVQRHVRTVTNPGYPRRA
jgi:hypothetical protein